MGAITKQQIGAYGEKAVEAELLRNGWITANINTSIKNAADFDIFARKGNVAVNIRVKACGPSADGFTFSGFRPKQRIKASGLGKADFTVLVAMGRSSRNEDAFYVVPTGVVRKCLDDHRTHYLRKDGRHGKRKDLGWWTLRLPERRANPFGSGFAKKWIDYLSAWPLLERRRR